MSHTIRFWWWWWSFHWLCHQCLQSVADNPAPSCCWVPPGWHAHMIGGWMIQAELLFLKLQLVQQNGAPNYKSCLLDFCINSSSSLSSEQLSMRWSCRWSLAKRKACEHFDFYWLRDSYFFLLLFSWNITLFLSCEKENFYAAHCIKVILFFCWLR